jgi:CRISPR-associated protein Cas1
MEKRFFAIFSNGVIISKNGSRLVFQRGDEKISIPTRYLRSVLVFGKVSLTGDATNLLLSEDIPIFFLTQFGRMKGFLMTELVASNYNNRLEQYSLFLKNRLEVAKFFVLKKLEEIENTFSINLADERKLLEEANNLDAVRGVEGIASRKMFEKVKKLLEGTDWNFEGRSYRPPTDEVNALLSLSYTLVYATALPLVVGLGYDPYISFLHSKRGTHAAFCSDLMEPIRPFITLRLVEELTRGLFKRDDFKKDPRRGYYLTESGLWKFLNWFERITAEVTEKLSDTLGDFSVLLPEKTY